MTPQMSLMRPFNHSTLSGMGGEKASPRCRLRSCLTLSISLPMPLSTRLTAVINANAVPEQMVDRQAKAQKPDPQATEIQIKKKAPAIPN